MTQQIVPTNLVPLALGRQQLTPSIVTALTVPAGAKFAYLQAEGSNIRWTDDGTTVEDDVGMLLIAGQAPFPYPGDLSKLSFIDDAATSGTLHVHYYGYKGAAA